MIQRDLNATVTPRNRFSTYNATGRGAGRPNLVQRVQGVVESLTPNNIPRTTGMVRDLRTVTPVNRTQPMFTEHQGQHVFRRGCVGMVELALQVDPEGMQARLDTLADSIQRGKMISKDMYQIRELIGAAAEAIGYAYVHGDGKTMEEFDNTIDELLALQQGRKLIRDLKTPVVPNSKYVGDARGSVGGVVVDINTRAAQAFQTYCKQNNIEIHDANDFRTFWLKMNKKKKDFKDCKVEDVYQIFQKL